PWCPATGAFPCGAVVAGVNDGPIRCTNVHERLNVNAHGCHPQASAASTGPPEAGDDEGDEGPRGNRQAVREGRVHSDRAEWAASRRSMTRDTPTSGRGRAPGAPERRDSD